MNLNNAICLLNISINYVPEQEPNYWIPLKVSWLKITFLSKRQFGIVLLLPKIYEPFVYEIFTSQLSSSWMSILKICTFAPLNAGGSISASYWIFMPYNSTAWIDGMTFVRGNERFAHPVRDLERNSNHTILKYMWQDEGKIGNRKPFQSCASFAFWYFIQKIWI